MLELVPSTDFWECNGENVIIFELSISSSNTVRFCLMYFDTVIGCYFFLRLKLESGDVL